MKAKSLALAPRDTLFAAALRFALGIGLVTMTMAFVLVPYVLSGHPGEGMTQAAAQTAAARHLS